MNRIRRNIVMLLWIWLAAVTAANGQGIGQGGNIQADDSLMAMGRRYFEQHDAERALACFLPVSARQGDDRETVRLRVRALNNIGCVYKYLQQDYIKGYDSFMQAYQLCEASGDQEFLAVIMVNLGDLLGDYGMGSSSQPLAQQSHDIFDKCIGMAFDSGNWDLMTTAFFNLATLDRSLPLENYRRIFATEIPDSTRDLQYVRLLYQGLEQLQQKRYNKARHYFEQQLAVVDAPWQPERDTLATLMNIAHTYRMEADYDKEADYLEQALQLASTHDMPDQEAGIHHLLTEAEAHNMAERQRLQQIIIGFIGVLLLFVGLSAALLWHKNQQLSTRNKLLYDKNRQLLQAEAHEQQLRQEVAAVKYSGSNLSSEQSDTLADQIETIMSTAEEICQEDFSLTKLAKIVDSNTSYVSRVVNERYGQAFSNVLANRRVREACRRIDANHDHYRHKTIEAIASGVGFRSRTSFINAFKREVGLTPSEYLRLAKNSDSNDSESPAKEV